MFIAALLIHQSDTPVKLSSSFRVTLVLLVASLIIALLGQYVSFGGWPFLGRFVVM